MSSPSAGITGVVYAIADDPIQIDELRRQADKEILHRSFPAYFIYSILCLAFGLASPARSTHHLSTALFVSASVALLGVRLWYHYRSAALRRADPARWRRIFAHLTIAAGIVWAGFVCFILRTRGLDTTTLLLLLCASGLSAGATNSLSPNIRLLRLYLVSVAGPVALTTWTLGGATSILLGAVVLLQLGFHLVEGARMHQSYWEALTNSFLLSARQRKNALLATAIAEADEAMAILDAEKRPVYANPALLRFTGGSIEEIDLQTHIREADNDAVDPFAVVAACGVWRGRFVRRRQDGQMRTLEASISGTRDAKGRLTHHVLVERDVTAQREMEARLRMADRMASIGTLAAGIAHEINNPLAYVIGNLEVAIDALPGRAVAGEPAAALGEALQGATRIRDIMGNIKIFARPEEGRRERVELWRVIDSAVDMTRNEIRHRARLVKQLGAVPPVEGSQSRLGQVVMNLLVNAAQAIREGAADRNEIRVSTSTDSAGRAVLEIGDTGSGIAPELLGRIFDPFFTTKPVGQGMGLGLSLCHGIVESLGGQIAVESELGKGTTFRVTLPAAAAPAEAPVPAAAVSAGRRGRILVIDDEPLVARTLLRVLGKEHEVVAISRGQEALARLLGGEAFDLILCDVMMPEMTGMDLHAELARQRPELGERMMFLTGGAFTPCAREFLERIPNQRIDKPFEGRALRALVHAWLEAHPETVP